MAKKRKLKKAAFNAKAIEKRLERYGNGDSPGQVREEDESDDRFSRQLCRYRRLCRVSELGSSPELCSCFARKNLASTELVDKRLHELPWCHPESCRRSLRINVV